MPLSPIISEYDKLTEQKYEEHTGTKRNKWVAFTLCIVLGFFGAHKFYEKKFLIGILYFFTGGLAAFGVVLDAIIILCHDKYYYIEDYEFEDAEQRYIPKED